MDSFILGAGVCAIDFFMLYCLARSLIFQDVCSGVLGRVGLLLLKYIFICATYMYILVFLLFFLALSSSGIDACIASVAAEHSIAERGEATELSPPSGAEPNELNQPS